MRAGRIAGLLPTGLDPAWVRRRRSPRRGAGRRTLRPFAPPRAPRAPPPAASLRRASFGVVTARLEDLLRRAFPDATELSVVDRTGGGDHFQVTVASAQLTGLPLVEQHRLVYDALQEPLADGTIHELRIKTRGER